MAKSLSPPDCFIALQGRRIITRVRILWGLYKREVEVVEELGDEDALLIGQIWFNHHYPVINVNPDSIRTECRKLNMELPDERDENVVNLLVQIIDNKSMPTNITPAKSIGMHWYINLGRT